MTEPGSTSSALANALDRYTTMQDAVKQHAAELSATNPATPPATPIAATEVTGNAISPGN